MDKAMDHDKQQHAVHNNNANNNNNAVPAVSEPPSLRAVRPAWSMHPHIQRTPSMKRRQQQQQQLEQQQQRVDAVIQALPQPPAAPPSPRMTQSPPRSASSASHQQVFFPPASATASATASTTSSPRHSPRHGPAPSTAQGQVSRGSSEDYDLVCKVRLEPTAPHCPDRAPPSGPDLIQSCRSCRCSIDRRVSVIPSTKLSIAAYARMHSFIPTIPNGDAGDAAGRLGRRQDLPAGALPERLLPQRQLHLHRRRGLQGEQHQ